MRARIVFVVAMVIGMAILSAGCVLNINGQRWVCTADGSGPIVDANGNHWRCELSWWQPGDPMKVTIP